MGMFRVGTLATLHRTESSQGPGTKAGLANGTSSGGWRGPPTSLPPMCSWPPLTPPTAAGIPSPCAQEDSGFPAHTPTATFFWWPWSPHRKGALLGGNTAFLSSFPVTPHLGYLSQEPRVRAGYVRAGQAWKAQGYRLLWDFVDQ